MDQRFGSVTIVLQANNKSVTFTWTFVRGHKGLYIRFLSFIVGHADTGMYVKYHQISFKTIVADILFVCRQFWLSLATFKSICFSWDFPSIKMDDSNDGKLIFTWPVS